MSALTPDYDSDPERWQSWKPPQDVHEMIAPELRGPVLDIGCGEGRLAAVLSGDVRWVGVDSSPAQLAANPFESLVLGDMRALPFGDETFAEVAHLWCLYHLDDPVPAIREAKRVLRRGGRYYASCSARSNDPEIMPEGYPPSSFDAEEAASIVGSVFEDAEPEGAPRLLVEASDGRIDGDPGVLDAVQYASIGGPRSLRQVVSSTGLNPRTPGLAAAWMEEHTHHDA